MQNTFNFKRKSYDRYESFYSADDGFVSFETGEVMYTANYPDVYARQYYPEPQVTIAFTNNLPKNFKLINPDTGKSIPDAQLKHEGGQHILIDHQSKKAIKLMSWNHTKNLQIPNRLKSSSAYSLASNADVVGAPITVFAPFVMNEQCKTWLKTLKVTATLMASLPTEDSIYFNELVIMPNDILEFSPLEYITNLNNNNPRFVNYGAHKIAQKNIIIGRQKTEHAYLNVEFK